MYGIAGLKMLFSPDLATKYEIFTQYGSDCNGTYDAVVRFRKYIRIDQPEGRQIIKDCVNWYENPVGNGGYTAILHGFGNPDKIICRIDSDWIWSNVSVSYIVDYDNIDIEFMVVCSFVNLVLRNLILHHKGILLHASAIKFDGKGIAFSAPSGTGKSTHAGLWETYYKADVLNDDSPAIRLNGDKCSVYGTPWSGATSKNKNDNVPLSAVVILAQSMKNKIRELSKQEAVLKLMPRFLLPYQDSKLMSIAISRVENIIDVTPIYYLECRPDKDALDLVCQRI